MILRGAYRRLYRRY